jgi:hypothetical protein
MIARDANRTTTASRLVDAAARGESLEVILVLRGKVRPSSGSRRWRIRLEGGGVLSFDADWVVAATPAPRTARR